MPFHRVLPPSRSVPLALALLVLATGCVTVRAAPARVPASARADASAPARPVVRELPLGPLPLPPPSQTPVPGAPVPRAPAAAGPERDDAPAAGPRTHRKPAAAPAPAAKPRGREPVRRPAPRPAPAPRRTYDMAPLCEAARGTVSPAIVALCH
ncbi:hypothetical protein ACGFXC_07565 [Streptomyces sp. NPDC048507]|uniref:hypothetical protein n=1 Tax=Streptomyces sp. NPDC048507 TaxID=3365560 RepID=UPI00371E9F3B